MKAGRNTSDWVAGALALSAETSSPFVILELFLYNPFAFVQTIAAYLATIEQKQLWTTPHLLKLILGSTGCGYYRSDHLSENV